VLLIFDKRERCQESLLKPGAISLGSLSVPAQMLYGRALLKVCGAVVCQFIILLSALPYIFSASVSTEL